MTGLLHCRVLFISANKAGYRAATYTTVPDYEKYAGVALLQGSIHSSPRH